MPIIYLSPSTQDWNHYVTGSGSEEKNMNLLADELIPYLRSNAIRYVRNTPDMTAASSIRQANAGDYDLYLALHSNASGEDAFGKNRGIIAFYYPGSARGQQAAELIAQELRKIYPLPHLVTTRPTSSLGEVRRSRFPAVLVEIGYHDNYQDALWIQGHRQEIARQLGVALTRYFDVPFIAPMGPYQGEVDLEWGSLNLREKPDPKGEILARMPNDSPLTVTGSWNGWNVVEWQGLAGYAAEAYIDLD